jgi:hypothetical protein
MMYNKTRCRRPPGNFVMHGLCGSIINNEKSFFTNESLLHPDSIKVPQVHP